MRVDAVAWLGVASAFAHMKRGNVGRVAAVACAR